ncbi:CheD, stimulates methylation of MCP protein [mine drainage metagenome]|jgi:chemotaxis protein CheD|uniref:CheD, stimulates methylation of MCP protein n=2 Tax=root TaxID=1 RepID=T0XTI4_9ZZZZ|nr:chemoreceptor glutamine deamidase CheD [Ferrovum myxofaciens]NDU89255.1 chemoreceptor glutamine deamidase CheD [Ferrovum sp.]KXW57736.1 chemoreceptor glutamine deamidase CheD [Ferrovum myxofaciens]QKE39329.1 MAG: chemoreceptor glutamine deamidase CheD [Ferrovum myxofaciens]QKE41883.1 MAG: chemoreceptor glutamine deamidase CheD [Ferrovum myxofaciens]QWY74597.1 MAG: chemoreceptor glutamine deamidase CheD [Ferrovum myxofaciens]
MTDTSCQEIFTPNGYFDRQFQREAIKILPGEYYVTGRDMVLVTVLGSCVAACLWDRVAGLGGMNHFMLPDDLREGGTPLSVAGRYGAYAMELMINRLIKAGARRNHLEAKVFGGAEVLRGFTTARIGERNAEFILEYLQTENIPVTAQDLMDIYPRKVYFFPNTGKILVKRLRSVHNDTIVTREQRYSERIRGTDISGGVELF